MFLFNVENHYSIFPNNWFCKIRASHRISHTSLGLVCHLVLSFFLDVRIQSCHFVVRWSRERKIRKYSLKREMKVSRSDCLNPFSDVLYEVPFVYRKPNKMTNLDVFIFEIIKNEKLGAKTLRNNRCLFHYSCKISWK